MGVGRLVGPTHRPLSARSLPSARRSLAGSVDSQPSTLYRPRAQTSYPDLPWNPIIGSRRRRSSRLAPFPFDLPPPPPCRSSQSHTPNRLAECLLSARRHPARGPDSSSSGPPQARAPASSSIELAAVNSQPENPHAGGPPPSGASPPSPCLLTLVAGHVGGRRSLREDTCGPARVGSLARARSDAVVASLRTRECGGK